MKTQLVKDIYDEELANNAIIHDGYIGFREDYLVLHCLLKTYKPKTLLEIGTHRGVGMNIICNAIPESNVYSLDLPFEKDEYSNEEMGLKIRELTVAYNRIIKLIK